MPARDAGTASPRRRARMRFCAVYVWFSSKVSRMSVFAVKEGLVRRGVRKLRDQVPAVVTDVS